MSGPRMHTLASLFGDVARVEIPIIQRDYAQGRAEEHVVRDAFLGVLCNALRRGSDDPQGRLNLDFVYGSTGPESDTFAILDGQQRLTTLFLLHWYCAVRDGQTEDFQRRFASAGRARLTYATRESAGMFFDALVCQRCVPPRVATGFADVIRDSRWFLLDWEFDPTVQACLGMLEAIHAVFHEETGLYGRLVAEGRITFEFLNLPDFGLSDDLYIKMNARGKALTPFENFKAWLVGRACADRAAAVEFDRRMDREWLDVFWNVLPEHSRGGAAAGELFMWFFYLVALYAACQADGRGSAAQDWLNRLNRRQPVSLAEFESHDSFGEVVLARAATVLDYLAGTPDPADVALCRQALLRNDLMDVARFGAVVEGICAAAAAGVSAADSRERLRWNRVSSNLVGNARIDDVSALQLAMRGTATLARHFATLYGDLAELDLSPVGFDSEQLNEEKVKARLIGGDLAWEPVLRAAEAHEYFQGRVGFLLEMSRTGNGHDMGVFGRYAGRAAALFARPLRESRELLLERALLSRYDYLPGWSFSRYSFCLPGARSFRDRTDNWFRVVRDPRFHDFLDLLGDGDARAALEEMIATSQCVDWRRHVVKEPELIRYCASRFIKRRNGRIYLISKLKASSRHVELYTYALYRKLTGAERDMPLPQGVEAVDYTQVTEGEPYLSLAFEDGRRQRIIHVDGGLRCFQDGEEVSPPADLAGWIADCGATSGTGDAAQQAT